MTMIGRATNKHFLLFTGAERFVDDAEGGGEGGGR